MLVALVVLATSTGCFNHRYINRSVVPGGETHRSWGSFFLWGIAGHQTVDVREHCGQNEVHEIVLGTNFLTWLVGLVTVGLYSPRVVVVRCGLGTAQVSFRLEPMRDRGPDRTAHLGVPALAEPAPFVASTQTVSP